MRAILHALSLNIVFLVLAAVLVTRFAATGGLPMLRMMGGPPAADDAHGEGGHGEGGHGEGGHGESGHGEGGHGHHATH